MKKEDCMDGDCMHEEKALGKITFTFEIFAENSRKFQM